MNKASGWPCFKPCYVCMGVCRLDMAVHVNEGRIDKPSLTALGHIGGPDIHRTAGTSCNIDDGPWQGPVGHEWVHLQEKYMP